MKNIFQLSDPRADRAFLLAAKHYLVKFPKTWTAQKLYNVLNADGDDDDDTNFLDQKEIAVWEVVEEYMERKGDYILTPFFLSDLILTLAQDIYFFDWNNIAKTYPIVSLSARPLATNHKNNTTVKNYTEEQIETMREILCRDEYEALTEKDLYHVLFEGVKGWKNILVEDVIEEFEELYPDEDQRAELLK